MEGLTRRDFLKTASAIAGGLSAGGAFGLSRVFALEARDGGVPVLWLQAQSCSGCSVSLLNSVQNGTVDQLLTQTLDLDYHPTLMAAGGHAAFQAAEDCYDAGGYVLVVEGAVPAGARGEYCFLWEGMTALRGVKKYASRAAHVLAVGSCACYGGVVGGAPNPTAARGLSRGIAGKSVICIPGCPAHPDWVVGTVAYLVKFGQAPPLDTHRRPREFFARKVHDQCPLREVDDVYQLSQQGCLEELGCRGQRTYGDCPVRRWNSPQKDSPGVNWCVGAGSPCFGCTEPGFPDRMSPFYDLRNEDHPHDSSQAAPSSVSDRSVHAETNVIPSEKPTSRDSTDRLINNRLRGDSTEPLRRLRVKEHSHED